MTKLQYKHGFEHKRKAREFIINQFGNRHDTIIGLAGPSIKQYYDWCTTKGFKNIVSYEYDKRIINRQRVLKIYHDMKIDIKAGSIINAPIRKDAVYDIDLCDSIVKKDRSTGRMINLEIIQKFKDVPYFITMSCRGTKMKAVHKMFFSTISEKIVSVTEESGKIYNVGSTIVYTYTTNKGKYLIFNYKDWTSPPMICISKIK